MQRLPRKGSPRHSSEQAAAIGRSASSSVDPRVLRVSDSDTHQTPGMEHARSMAQGDAVRMGRQRKGLEKPANGWVPEVPELRTPTNPGENTTCGFTWLRCRVGAQNKMFSANRGLVAPAAGSAVPANTPRGVSGGPAAESARERLPARRSLCPEESSR